MFSKLDTFIVAFTLTILGLGSAVAQSGGITGTVKDASGAVLPGARVEVLQGPSAVSDGQGQYWIPNLAAASYKVSVTYVGFAGFAADVTVEAGKIAHLDAALTVENANESVTVNGGRELGEVEAINIERTADNIVQVLPSNVIRSLPNTNVADAIGRLPSVSLERDEGEGKYLQIRGTEPRLSNVTVDGVNLPSPEAGVRNIKLDVIPSGLVDRIEVNKTLSANQDGDAIGGSVNLVTKTPGERPTFDVDGTWGHTNIIGGRSLTALNSTYGQRFGAAKKLGFLFSTSYDWNGRGINDLEPGPTTTQVGGTGPSYPIFSSADLRTYKYYRTRYGFAPELDYVIKPGSSVYLRGLYSDFHDFGETWVYSPNVGALTAPPSGSQYTFDNTGFMQYRQYVRRPDQQIFSGLAGGRNDMQSTFVTYEFSVSRAHNIGGQDFTTAKFNGGPLSQPGIAFGLNTSNPYEPKFPVLNSVDIYGATQYSLSSYTVPYNHSTQLNYQGAASFGKRYSVSEHYGTFQLGVKIRNAHKTQSENDAIYDSPTVNIPLSGVLGTFSNPTYYDHAYQFGPLSDYGKIIQQATANLSNLGYDPSASRIQSDPANFAATERVYAGYAMNTIGFGKLSVQTGLRIEATDDNYQANQVNLSNGSYVNTVPVGGSGGYISVLPSIQLQYRIQANTNLRGTFGIGISRPNFSDIVPSKQVDPNFTPPTVVVGNPALKPTKANNYDILVEHYFRPYGILQAGFFYKTLSNPIYPTTSIIPAGQPNAGFHQQESINGPSGHITVSTK